MCCLLLKWTNSTLSRVIMCVIWCHHYAQDEYEVSTSDCEMCTLMDDKDSFNYNWDKTNSFLKWSSLWEGRGAKLLPCYTDMFPFSKWAWQQTGYTEMPLAVEVTVTLAAFGKENKLASSKYSVHLVNLFLYYFFCNMHSLSMDL